MHELANKIVIITGASEGIGRAVAVELADVGARLVLAARNTARLEEVAGVCRDRGASCLGVTTNVADPGQCRTLIERAVEEFGGLDVLINNAGMTMWFRFEDLEQLDVLGRLMDVNYFGSVYTTHFALPHLRRARGRLVAIASVAGITGVPERTGYAASKHAMVGFFESLRIELRDTGVSVTIVAPDFVRSQVHRRALDGRGQSSGETRMQSDRIMSAERCAEIIIDAMTGRRRLVITSWRGRLGRWARLLAPTLIDWVTARAIARGR
jgi:NAD(P)-dependent dehydrogenase (short-subunit alcohol dehydrogenase family)